MYTRTNLLSCCNRLVPSWLAALLAGAPVSLIDVTPLIVVYCFLHVTDQHSVRRSSISLVGGNKTQISECWQKQTRWRQQFMAHYIHTTDPFIDNMTMLFPL